MKTFKDLIVELSTMQRIKRSKIMKVKGKMIARKRAIAMKKPPTPEKIQKALDRKLRQKALNIADKSGAYRDASAGVKQNIEKKASKILAKKKGVWTKKLRPEVRRGMKDAFRERTGVKNPEAE